MLGRAKILLGEERQYYEILPDVITQYGEALRKGVKHVMQVRNRRQTHHGLHVVGRTPPISFTYPIRGLLPSCMFTTVSETWPKRHSPASRFPEGFHKHNLSVF